MSLDVFIPDELNIIKIILFDIIGMIFKNLILQSIVLCLIQQIL